MGIGQVILSTSNKENIISMHDLSTGTVLGTFKNNKSEKNCTYFSDNLRDGWIFSAQNQKGIIHVWNWSKDSVHMKIFCQEKVTCLSVSHDDVFCAVGTENGYVNVWRISDGALVKKIAAHFRSVTVVKFTFDSSFLVSASEDGSVSVWNHISEVLTPVQHWNDHTLPVSGLHISYGISGTARIASASLDGKVIFYDLNSGAHLFQVKFPSPISCLVCDALETRVFVGDEKGNILWTSLREKIEFGIVSSKIESFSAQTEVINSLILSLDDSVLCSASADGTICSWDVQSRQCIRKIQMGSPVTMISLCIKPETFFNKSKKLPIISQFSRVVEEDNLVTLRLKTDFHVAESGEEVQSDNQYAELEAKYITLKEMHEKYKKMHEEFYAMASQKLLNK